jgi:hypothetical protein
LPPVITDIFDNANPVTGVVSDGGATNDTSLLLNGTAEANSTINLYNGTTLLATFTADEEGNWSRTVSGLSNGTTYDFNATATDAANNVSGPSDDYTRHRRHRLCRPSRALPARNRPLKPPMPTP